MATTASVWDAMEHNVFGVLAFTNAKGEPRSAGIVYVVDGRSLYVSTAHDSWKVRHIRANPVVSMTVAIPKRIPFLPFIKVPAATVTFHGDAEVLEVGEVDPAVRTRLFRSSRVDDDMVATIRIIHVVPRGHFVTYGIDVPLLDLADHDRARDRVPCGTEAERLVTTAA